MDARHLTLFWVFRFFPLVPPNETMKIKVVEMTSNFERFQKIQKQADSEIYGSLCHGTKKSAKIPLPVAKMIWSFQFCPKFLVKNFKQRALIRSSADSIYILSKFCICQ